MLLKQSCKMKYTYTLYYGLLYSHYLMRPPGGANAKHIRSGYNGFSRTARRAAAPAPKLCPVITKLLPLKEKG